MTLFTKICGVVFVVFATSAYGYVLSRDLKKRLLELLEIKKIMFLLKGEIGYGFTPLFEAMGNIALRVSPPFSHILLSFAEREKEIKECAFKDMWEQEFEKGLVSAHLSNSERERLIGLGSSIGLNDYKTQQTAIEAYMQEVENSIAELEKCLPAKTKLYRSLGVMLGVVITIIIV